MAPALPTLTWIATGSKRILSVHLVEYADRVRAALDVSRAQREAINSVYDGILPAGCQLAPEYQLWRYNILVKDKNKILEAIFSGMDCSRAVTLHRWPGFSAAADILRLKNWPAG